jgi:hypothetical protein
MISVKAESTTGYFYLLPLLLLSYTKVFFVTRLGAWGSLCTVKKATVSKLKRPGLLGGLGNFFTGFINKTCFEFCINAYASDIIDAPRLPCGIENTYIQECESVIGASSFGTDRRWRSLGCASRVKSTVDVRGSSKLGTFGCVDQGCNPSKLLEPGHKMWTSTLRMVRHRCQLMDANMP